MFHEGKVNFLVFVVVMTACFARSQPRDKNQICQDYKGAGYVWDKHVQTCVACTSCTPGAQDPHCITCRALGIIPDDTTPSSGDPPELGVPSSAPLPPPSTTANSSPSGMSSTTQTNVRTPLPPPSTMANSSSSGMGSTTQTNVTNGDSKGSVALWIILPCLAVAIVVIILCIWKFKGKKKEKERRVSQPEQETGPPAETPQMAALLIAV